MLPIEEGRVSWPDGPALFLRARYGHALGDAPRGRLVCEQTFKPAVDTLKRAGFTLRDDDQDTYGLTLVLPQRQRDENRALLARAVAATNTGGIVLAAASNAEGAKTLEGDLRLLTGQVDTLSKNKCRAFWSRIDPAKVDRDVLEAWIAADEPRDIGGYVSRPGVFSWDRIDAGSRLLIEHLPHDLKGRVADLGAGIGYLAKEVLTLCPGVTHIDLYEAEHRALDMARQNLAAFGDKASGYWADVTRGIQGEYDATISNPPFHIDRADRHELGQAFIKSAAAALKRGGALLMVANRHLPYEETLKDAFKTVTVLTETGAYKVFWAVKK
ncbi:class I SAM-dependent methyltransferase [Asticcacaulis solisilvae]|uniref:class I SAM-dependent methyltransferase n=1 Tax=Asticcacaulis solisilvae TaxID=1217274 RepID=UPI003FD8E0E1